MSGTNQKIQSIKTHEGAKAKNISLVSQLRRSVMSCMLWENSFYEQGQSISARIAELCRQVDKREVQKLALEAKHDMGIRHNPLWMAVSAKIFYREFLVKLITRPDDMAEILAMYWLDGKKPIPKQMKLAFSDKLNQFDGYQLAKYRGLSKDIKLKDIIRLIHPSPVDADHARWFDGVVNDSIQAPDTWETALMTGGDKKETFERLISDRKLGALAMLRNLRNMKQAGVGNIRDGLESMKCRKILPFQFINSARYAPEYEDVIEKKMLEAVEGFGKLPGKTVILVDVSGSMDSNISGKSEIRRDSAAGGVAIMAREICEEVAIFAFGTNVYEIPNRRGFALSDLLRAKNEGTNLGGAVSLINETQEYDRIIVITDEQSRTSVPDPKGVAYLVNVSCEKNGVGYYSWTHIDGWSPSVLKYIMENER